MLTCLDLSDIDLQLLRKYKDNVWENKNLCFLREKISDINYGHGSHECHPSGHLVFSSNVYINKHMSKLGLNFMIDKIIKRFNRSRLMRTYGFAIHYTDNIVDITNMYTEELKTCSIME